MMTDLFEAYCKIYRRDDNNCDFCGEEIEKGKVKIIDRMQCHLHCYCEDVRKKKLSRGGEKQVWEKQKLKK